MFKAIEIDVFWPLLMFYFVVLVSYTVHKIAKKMQKYNYSISDFTKKNNIGFAPSFNLAQWSNLLNFVNIHILTRINYHIYRQTNLMFLNTHLAYSRIFYIMPDYLTEQNKNYMLYFIRFN